MGVASPVGDAKCGEPEACGGDAGGEVSIEFTGSLVLIVSAVEHLPGGKRVGLLYEEETGSLLHVFEEDEVIVA